MDNQGRIRFHGERCIWCRSCELICSLYRERECNPMLSRIRILLDIFEAEAQVSVCRQCDDPACLKACPVGAIRVDDRTGAYILSEDACTACGLCAEACPYNSERKILFYNPAKNAYAKCDLCLGQVQCVQICPSKALEYTSK